MEWTFTEAVEHVGQAVEIVGIAVIVLGIVYGAWLVLLRGHGGDDAHSRFRAVRQAVGRAILLGLEILIAADIIRTVAISPTFRSVGVLAIIVAIRIVLSFELELEINGRWPWQRAAAHDDHPAPDRNVSSSARP
jgi:uncharacterized membrane protein